MRKEIIILLAAILMGVAAVVFNSIYLESKQKEESLRERERVVASVVHLSVNLEPGAKIERSHLFARDIPEMYVHPRAVTWDKRDLVIGQEARVSLQARQPLLWSDMIDVSSASLGEIIAPGCAVVTLSVNALGSAAGLIRPGSKVDVLAIFDRLPSTTSLEGGMETGQLGRDAEGLRALEDVIRRMEGARREAADDFHLVTVARNLSVFAVGGDTKLSRGRETGRFSTISFDVPPRLQAVLLLAQEYASRNGGRLVCVLRSSTMQASDPELDAVYRPGDIMRLIDRAK